MPEGEGQLNLSWNKSQYALAAIIAAAAPTIRDGNLAQWTIIYSRLRPTPRIKLFSYAATSLHLDPISNILLRLVGFPQRNFK